MLGSIGKAAGTAWKAAPSAAKIGEWAEKGKQAIETAE